MPASQYGRRTREFQGPGLGTVAIVAKPTQLRPPEWRILDRRAEQQRRLPFDQAVNDQAFAAQRLEFELAGDVRIKETAVQMKMRAFDEGESAELHARRSRLKEMLDQEESANLQAGASSVETTLEKQSKMREQARTLRERREEQRAELAQSKLEEAWRKNCEPLRTVMSLQTAIATDKDRFFQMDQKRAIKQQEAWVDQIYAESWKMDQLAKHARESADIKRVRQESRHLNDCLDAQVALLEKNRAEDLVLKGQEKALRFEQAALLKAEEHRERELDVAKKKQLKRVFDKDVTQKTVLVALQVKADLEADLVLIETLKREAESEVTVSGNKKQQLRQEAESYLKYLQDMKAFETEQEAIRETFLEAEKQRSNTIRRTKFAKEREARAGLMREVVQTLQEQMETKWVTIMKSREDKIHEAAQIAAGIADLNRQADAKAAAIAAGNRLHQKELLEQVDDIAYQRHEERAIEAKLSEDMLAGYRREEAKINTELDRIAKLRVGAEPDDLGLGVTGTGLGGNQQPAYPNWVSADTSHQPESVRQQFAMAEDRDHVARDEERHMFQGSKVEF